MTKGSVFRTALTYAAVAIVVVYLSIGMAFARYTMPKQTWRCPDAAAPHGEVIWGGMSRAPRDDCLAMISVGDRVGWFVFATSGWLPLLAVRAGAGAM